MVGWQKRYFVLFEHKLKYWKNLNEFMHRKHPKGILDFTKAQVEVIGNPKNNNIDLRILGCDRVFHLKSSQHEVFKSWEEALKTTTQKYNEMQNEMNNKRGKIISEIEFAVDFWRFDMIDEHDFLQQADTGDILLFRGSHLGAKITRKWTHGHVDHAAMIVKLKRTMGNSIFMLESVMVRGVSFASWDMFKKNNDIYEEVYYRKLNCKRDEEFYQKFEDFIEQVQGNEYGLQISKFIFSNNMKRSQSIIGQDLEKRQFFCSELIVKCYKELGIMKPIDRASSTFAPSDLTITAKDPLIMNNGYELMDDQLILIKKGDRKAIESKKKKRTSILTVTGLV